MATRIWGAHRKGVWALVYDSNRPWWRAGVKFSHIEDRSWLLSAGWLGKGIGVGWAAR